MVRLILAMGVLPLVLACSAEEQVEDPQMQDNSSEFETAPQPAKPSQLAVSNDLYEFTYQWPSEAAAIEPLNAFFEANAETQRAEFEALAARAKSEAAEYDYPYRPYAANWDWNVLADTPLMLSLGSKHYAFTGGAHGNTQTGAMIWDREAGEKLASEDLFTSPKALHEILVAPYCAGLADERRERLGEDMVVGDYGTIPCPSIDQLTLALAASDGQILDQIVLIADPYVAGAYAEGIYEVTVEVDKDILALVKPEYRGAFAANEPRGE